MSSEPQSSLDALNLKPQCCESSSITARVLLQPIKDCSDIEEHFGDAESGIRSRKIDIFHQLYPRGARDPMDIVAWEEKPETLHFQLCQNIRTNANVMNRLAPYLEPGFPSSEPIVLDIIGSRALAYIVKTIEPSVFGEGTVSEGLI
ncbi:hypothetical protein FBU30_007660 [Linnemannia zychae]|nr:hypothetical protein FBU30_007660 [Linnemannia zychae]